MAKPAHNIPRSVGATIDALKTAKTKTERAQILKDDDSLALRSILRLNFDPNLKLDLPDGFPSQYRQGRNPDEFGSTTLKAAVSGFYVFVQSSTPKLRQAKREILFLQLLEALDNREAKILVDAKDKKLDAGLTRKLVEEVFPGLLPAEVKSSKTDDSSGDEDETTSTGKSG